jgi:hypothetical protein
MKIDKPFSQACENNKRPILKILSRLFNEPVTIWEVGSGTGQHACFFAQQLTHIIWQPTDLADHLETIHCWVQDATLTNLNSPLKLNVTDHSWPCSKIDALFTANTLHIMSWSEVETFFLKLKDYLNSGAYFCIYGPFNYQGAYTSASNASFDQQLKSRDALSGIRDFESIQDLAKASNLDLMEDNAMPANNRLLVFKKS